MVAAELETSVDCHWLAW